MSNFVMSGGDASLADLIASVKRGVLISRFWYIRALNPRMLSQTGHHPRRNVPDRERQDQPSGHELPLQPVAGRPAEERRDARAADARLREREQLGRAADCRARAEGARVQSGQRQRRHLIDLRFVPLNSVVALFD